MKSWNPLRWLSRGIGWGLIAMVRLYQLTLSPIIGGQCKYLPSCSNYCIEAIQTRGPLVGTLLSAWRLVRCNPLSKGGYDPVPRRK